MIKRTPDVSLRFVGAGAGAASLLSFPVEEVVVSVTDNLGVSTGGTTAFVSSGSCSMDGRGARGDSSSSSSPPGGSSSESNFISSASFSAQTMY